MSEIRVDNITDEAGTGRPDFSNGIKTSNINGGPIGRRNTIINGNFGVNQRGVSGTVNLSAGEYGHDRWKAGSSGATYTFSTSGGVTTIDISAGSLIQVVEDVNLVTDTYVLSFEGTAQGKIGSGSFGDSGVVESVTGGSNLNIEFSTGTVSKVQLEVGDTATEFEHRSIGEELALCQRYYQIVDCPGTPGGFGINLNRSQDIQNAYSHTFELKTEMRTSPSFSSTNVAVHVPGSTANDTSAIFPDRLESKPTAVGLSIIPSSDQGGSHQIIVLNDGVIEFDAEL